MQKNKKQKINENININNQKLNESTNLIKNQLAKLKTKLEIIEAYNSLNEK